MKIREVREQDMRRGRKFLIFYFAFFGALSVVAVIPGGALILLLITAMGLPLFGMPGFLAIASPTILLYSIALVPLGLALTMPSRRILRIAAAVGLPIMLAIGPGLLSQQQARQFGLRMSKDDLSRPAAERPRTVELIGDAASGMFVYGQTVGDAHASCNEICWRLLFNGEADWVRMTRTPDIYINKRSGQTFSVSYHIERRDSCPQVYPDGTRIEKAVRDRLIAGDCLIADTADNAPPAATVTFTTVYFNQHYPARPPEQGPDLATVVTVKDLRIETRQAGTLKPVVQQTETVALTIALPFYIGSEIHMQGGYNGPTIGRNRTEMKAIDLAQLLRDTFGYKIAGISAPPSEDATEIAERILALPPQNNPVLSAQQQDALNDVLAVIAKQPALSDTDIDFVRRVVADKRVTEAKLGVAIQNIFRKYSALLEPLIPVVLDRISTPVAESVGHYQSMLGWSLTNYSADSLRPYRNKMVAIVEAQPDWPSSGVLTRLAELGSDEAVNLVIRRLHSKSVQQYAAIAACRASAEAWPLLEPAVLAHMATPRRGNSLQDEEKPLMLALVRFGKKSLVADMIEKRELFDKKRVLSRLEKFEAGFGPEHCRDFL
jgi:hypothetical protein